MNRAASPETGTKRKNFPGSSELSRLVRGTGIYQEQTTNYKVEERKILKEQKELKALFDSLEARKKKDETEA